MKKKPLCRTTELLTLLTFLMLLTLLLLPLPAHAGGFDVLSSPEIQSLDPDTMTIIWDEPDKPGNEDSPNHGRCSFLVSISGNCDGARLFTVVYKSSGMMRRVQVLDAEQTVPVTLTGLGQNDRISVILVDENARPLTSVTPAG